MPFTKYLQDTTGYDALPDNADPNHDRYSLPVEFQLPQFLYDGAPTLAPGGGAEVLPFSTNDTLASSWFTNNGLSTSSTDINIPQPHSLPVLPPLHDLPIYSASGFDLLSILTRVHTRPNPHIILGPVDLACSFVVADVRRHDSPIVYCSPSFCRLTGYAEHEVLGRNGRFLQAPGGQVPRGSERRDTSQSSVAHLKKALAGDKECQASLTNYRKDGTAFLNLVSVIPISGGVAGENPDEVVFHVGFQVDLTEQPDIILQKLRDGTHAIDYPATPRPPASTTTTIPPLSGKKASAASTALIPAPRMSHTLQNLLADPRFVASLPIATTTNVPPPAAEDPTANQNQNHPLSLVLLNHASDFIHVVSLKGTFLYVAPAVTRMLGYNPEELVGRSLADLAHPKDVAPLERELRESSTASNAAAAVPPSEDRAGRAPRTVDMLFRARTKGGQYVWLECRGRLLVEPGKGRKAIILSGRARAMGKVFWGEMCEMGGKEEGKNEFWGLVGGGTALLAAGAGVKGVLGWAPEEVVGRRIGWLIDEDPGLAGPDGPAAAVEEVFKELDEGKQQEGTERRLVRCWLRTSGGGRVKVEMTILRPAVNREPVPGESEREGEMGALPAGVTRAPLVVYVRVLVEGAGQAEFMPSPATYVDPGYGYLPGRYSSGLFGNSMYAAYDEYETFGQYVPSASVEHGETLTLNTAAAGSSGSVGEERNPVHALGMNVFKELEIGHASSWQYELQQLRFANLRLAGEIEALEAGSGQGSGQAQAQPVADTEKSPAEVPRSGEDRGRTRRRKKSVMAGELDDHGGVQEYALPVLMFSTPASTSTLPDVLRVHVPQPPQPQHQYLHQYTPDNMYYQAEPSSSRLPRQNQNHTQNHNHVHTQQHLHTQKPLHTLQPLYTQSQHQTPALQLQPPSQPPSQSQSQQAMLQIPTAAAHREQMVTGERVSESESRTGYQSGYPSGSRVDNFVDASRMGGPVSVSRQERSMLLSHPHPQAQMRDLVRTHQYAPLRRRLVSISPEDQKEMNGQLFTSD